MGKNIYYSWLGKFVKKIENVVGKNIFITLGWEKIFISLGWGKFVKKIENVFGG